MEKQIIIIAEEFPSHTGGVAYFSDVLAKKYDKENVLKGVISLSPFAIDQRNFSLIHKPIRGRNYGSFPLDNFVLTRKVNTLLYNTYSILTGRLWKPVIEALKALDYNPQTDILFFTYQVHQPGLFKMLYDRFKGEQWMLYHGLDLIGFKDIPEYVDYVSKNASKILFNSIATQNLYTELGFNSTVEQQVLYPFLDEDYLKTLKLYSVKQLEKIIGINLADAIVLTSICRLVKRKGIHFAIDIIATLIKKKKLNIQYFIGGDGPEFDILKKKVKDMELGNYIHFLGYVDDLLKYSLLNVSKVFLMPNYDDGGGDFEGFGISFLEAGYYNNHVIAGNHGGAIEAMNALTDYNLVDVNNESSLKVVEEKLAKTLEVYAN